MAWNPNQSDGLGTQHDISMCRLDFKEWVQLEVPSAILPQHHHHLNITIVVVGMAKAVEEAVVVDHVDGVAIDHNNRTDLAIMLLLQMIQGYATNVAPQVIYIETAHM